MLLSDSNFETFWSNMENIFVLWNPEEGMAPGGCCMPAVCLSMNVLRVWSCFKAAKIRPLRRRASSFGLPAGISFDPWNLLVCLWALGAVHKGRVMPFRLVKARGQIPGVSNLQLCGAAVGNVLLASLRPPRPSGNLNSSCGAKHSRMLSLMPALCLL